MTPKNFLKKKRKELRVIIEQEALAYAVSYVDHQKIDEINILNAALLAMQLSIEKIAPTLQYSVIPKSIGNLDSGKIWKSPFKDAADVIIEKILDRQTVHPINGWSNEELLRQHHEQKEIMEYHEDFAALRGRASGRNEDKINKKIAIQTVDENGNLPKTLTKSLQICAAI